MKQVVRPVPINRWSARAHRWRGRARYHLRALVRPSLRRGGPWILLGPSCELTLRRGARFLRGSGMSLRGNCHVDVQGELVVGRDVFVNSDVHLTAHVRIEIGDGVAVAERVSIHDGDHRYEPAPVLGDPRRDYLAEPITIGSRVWIGANSVVLAGTTIGDDCVVAAGSVVRGTFPPRCLVAGVPARVVRPLRTTDDERSDDAGERPARAARR